MSTTTQTETLECGHEESPHSEFTRGYGTDDKGARHCYACCAKNDAARMIETGRGYLYLTRDKDGREVVTNWSASLSFAARYVSRSRGYGFRRSYPIVTARFTGPDGKEWGIKVQGDMECGRVWRRA